MAQTSGEFSKSINNGYQQVIVKWSSTQNVDTNTSTIVADTYFKTVGNMSVGTRTNSTTIDGTTTSWSSSSVSGSGKTWKIGTVTTTINHNADGTKSFTMSSVYNIQATISGTYYSNITATSNTIELPTIPRASTFGVLDANIGSSTTITINKASSNFTTTLRYKASGQNSWTTIVTKTPNQSYSWTVPTSFYELIHSAKTISCQFEADTYSGDTLVGTKSATATFTATGNPTIGTRTATDVNTTTVHLTMGSSYSTSTTKMVKYASNIQVSVSATAQNSAYISSITVNGNAVTLDGTSTSTTRSGTYPVNGATTNTFEIKATDSRGYTTTQYTSNTLEMVNYVPLTINQNIRRNTPTDGKVNLNLSGVCWNGDFRSGTSNALTVEYRYKVSGASGWSQDWTSSGVTVSRSGNNYTATKQLTNMTYTTSYQFEVRATDSIGTKSIIGITVSKGQPVYWWNDSEFNVTSTLNVGGNANVGRLYQSGTPGTMPSGNGTSPAYWCALKNGVYWHTSSDNVTNMPQSWGYVIKEGYYSSSGSKGDFTVMFYTQATGKVYRTSGNGSTTTCVWNTIAYTSDVPTNTNQLTNGAGFITSSSLPSVTTGTGIVTRSSGATLSASSYAKYGNVVSLSLSLSTTSNTGVGSNVFVGNVNSSYKPRIYATGVSYNGSSGIIGVISTSGEIAIRIVGAQLGSSKSFSIGFTYIV